MGLDPRSVEAYIHRLDDQLEQKNKDIQVLKDKIMRLEFDKDDLIGELEVYKELHRNRNQEYCRQGADKHASQESD